MIAIVALTGTALAQELTPEQKNDALRKAYRLNGGVMNGPLVDLTAPPVEELPLIYPAPEPAKKAAAKAAPPPKADICRRHGKRKVVTRGGKSWRCR